MRDATTRTQVLKKYAFFGRCEQWVCDQCGGNAVATYVFGDVDIVGRGLVVLGRGLDNLCATTRRVSVKMYADS